MSDSNIGGIPATIVFTLIISFFAFFASVTFVTLYYYKRDPRRLQRLQQIERVTETQETIALGPLAEPPILWQVWADRYPKLTSKWEDLLPLNLTCDQPTRASLSRQISVLPAPQSRGMVRGSLGTQSIGGSQPNLNSTDCNISVFIAMPSPHEHIPPEFSGEIAIGTAGVLYRHPERPRP